MTRVVGERIHPSRKSNARIVAVPSPAFLSHFILGMTKRGLYDNQSGDDTSDSAYLWAFTTNLANPRSCGARLRSPCTMSDSATITFSPETWFAIGFLSDDMLAS